MSDKTEKKLRLDESLTDFKQLFKSPPTYLTNYFDSLCVLVDSECQKYIKIQTEAYERSENNPDPFEVFSKEDLESDINQTHQFKLNLIEEIEKFKLECLTRVNDEFSFSEELIEIGNQLLVESENVEEIDQIINLTERSYEVSLKLQAKVFGDKCFLLLSQKELDPELPFCCLLCIHDDYIGKQGEKYLKQHYARKSNNTAQCTYEYSYYRLSYYDQDAQTFPPHTVSLDYLKSLELYHRNLPLGFFDYTEINLNPYQLDSLYLQGLELTYLPTDLLNRFELLVEINLAMNHLATLPSKVFASAKNLTNIDLSGNIIQTLDPKLFAENSKLLTIQLQYNRLTTLDPDLFKNLSNLKTLNLSFNRLEVLDPSLLKSLLNLNSLDLTRNRLLSLDRTFFKGLAKLNYLFLGENRIGSIDQILFQDLTSLKTLFLNQNRIKEVAETVFSGQKKSLNQLFLQSNLLEKLPVGIFLELKSLKCLNLSSNKLKNLNTGLFKDLIELENLQVVNNKLGTLEVDVFVGLDGLVNLDLSGNNLVELECELLKGLSQLRNVSFYNNYVEEVAGGLFKYCVELERVSLHMNRIKDINLSEVFGRDLEVDAVEERGAYKFVLCKHELFVSLNTNVNVC